jgi:DNA-binding NarL/FixJ family response regulator
MKNTFLVFVVDDDPMFSEMLTDHLSQNKDKFRYDFTIRHFPVGELCIDNLHLSPDVVVLDFNLDSKYYDAVDGHAILRGIKTRCPGTDVFMLSSQEKVDVVAKLLDTGASGYIIKNESLFLRVRNALNDSFERRRGKYAEEESAKKRKMLVVGMAILLAIETAALTACCVIR